MGQSDRRRLAQMDMTLEHPFFQKSRMEQKRFQRNLALVSMLLLIVAGGALFLVGLLPLIIVVFAILLSIIAPFFDVPGLVRVGKLRYCSPFLLCEAEKNGKVVLHAGTLFDFYIMFTKDMSAQDRKRLVLSGMIDGLSHLIEHYEKSHRTDVTVRVTSYILNERNAAKLGLERRPTDVVQTLILYYNFFNLMASYSLLNRRLRFPSVKSVQTFEGSMAELIKRKPYLEKLRERYRRAGSLQER